MNTRQFAACRTWLLVASSLGSLSGLVSLVGSSLDPRHGDGGVCSFSGAGLPAGLTLCVVSFALCTRAAAGVVTKRRLAVVMRAGAVLALATATWTCLGTEGAFFSRGIVQEKTDALGCALSLGLLALAFSLTLAAFGRRPAAATASQLAALGAGFAGLVSLWYCFSRRSSLPALCVEWAFSFGLFSAAAGLFLLRPTAWPATVLFYPGKYGVGLRLFFVSLALVFFCLNRFGLGSCLPEGDTGGCFGALDAVFVVFLALLISEIVRRRPDGEERAGERRCSSGQASLPERWCEGLPFPVLFLKGETIVRGNGAASALLGCVENRALEGRALLDFVHLEDRRVVAQSLASVLSKTEVQGWRESHFLRVDGSGFEAEVSVGRFDPLGPGGLRVFLRDRSRLRCAEELLSRDARILSLIQEPVLCLNLDGTVVYWNEAARRLLAPEAGFGPGFPFLVCVCEENRREVEYALDLARCGVPQERALRFVGPGRPAQPLSARFVPLFDMGGGPSGLLCLVRPASFRREVPVSSFLPGERLFRSLFEGASSGLLVLSPNGTIVASNERFLKLVGYSREAVDGVSVRALLHPDDRELDERRRNVLFRMGRTEPFEIRFLKRDGAYLWMEESVSAVRDDEGNALYVLCLFQDVTRRRTLELQLLQSQKMDAVGKLAGGIAHDFGNVLTAIQGHVTLLEMNADFPESGRESLVEIAEASRRAASLTRQLLLFSRREAMQPRLQDLNLTISQFLKMLKRMIGENVRLVWEPLDARLPVYADTGMIEQVLMNLAVNARDAMPGGGTLTVETGEELLSDDSSTSAGLDPGRYVWFRTRDTGVGIARENRERIFEPFFTTKEAGKGTGLGLSTVLGIVRQHRGLVRLESEEGEGASFTILLPRREGSLDAGEPIPSNFVPAGAGETILWVEDDGATRDIVAKILARGRYKVLSARDGGHALSIFELEGAHIDLLLTDIVLPGTMDGLRLADELTTRKPDLKVLLSSGYGASIPEGLRREAQGWRFIRKPFEVAELLDSVRRTFAA